ncbi:MAG: hypothetical protein PSV18_01835 [Methylobacter sp.]|nr:hypothetical protein [Candidatus Methylobacter titanis]
MTHSKYLIPLDPDIASWVLTLDDNASELFQERAGIREFEGGLSRFKAEREAKNDVLRWQERQATGSDEN